LVGSISKACHDVELHRELEKWVIRATHSLADHMERQTASIEATGKAVEIN